MTNKNCCLVNCWKPRGGENKYCSMHRARIERTGKVNKITPLDRFFSYIRKTDGCWEWTGYKNAQGYGVFSFNRKDFSAHRFMWGHAVGEIPDNLHVLHKCDNPSCVNPSHLFLGTNRDNINDMVSKGRCPSGEDHCHSRITSEDAIEIVRLNRQEKMPYRDIGERYGYTGPAILKICKGINWGKVTKHAREVNYE